MHLRILYVYPMYCVSVCKPNSSYTEIRYATPDIEGPLSIFRLFCLSFMFPLPPSYEFVELNLPFIFHGGVAAKSW
jgi:hypothetical protein